MQHVRFLSVLYIPLIFIISCDMMMKDPSAKASTFSSGFGACHGSCVSSSSTGGVYLCYDYSFTEDREGTFNTYKSNCVNTSSPYVNWSDGGCTRTNALGGCKYTLSYSCENNGCYTIYWYYSTSTSTSAATLKASCNNTYNGTWVEP